MAFVLAAFIALLVRLYILQVSRGSYFAERSRANFVKTTPLASDRGMILDRRGRILADERPAYDLTITPAFCPNVDEVLSRLALGVSVGPDEIDAARGRIKAAQRLARFQPVRVARNISRDALDWTEAHRLELDGVDVHVRPRRHYLAGATLYHVLGYVNEIGPKELTKANAAGKEYRLGDSVGRSGLEEIFEEQLRGQDGEEQVVVDAKGRRLLDLKNRDVAGEALLQSDESVIQAPTAGHNLVLSIDLRLQETVEKEFPGLAGAVVAVDPRDGFILAMLSRPAPDPNLLTSGISQGQMQKMREDPLEPMIHRAIQQHYHPGSTFKPFTALAALDQGITKDEAAHCNGAYRLGRRRWRCWRAAGHGTISLEPALQHSCDTYFYWVADRIDINPIAKWARAAGFGRSTGCGLPHEVPGIIPDVAYHDRVSPDGYTRGFALNAAIGQGDVNVTPLQLAMAYATIGNGGLLYRPQLVRQIEDAEGHILQTFGPELRGRLPSKPEDLAAVREGLRRVVMEPGGTAYYRYPRREGFSVPVAGKTGTAQVVRLGEEREKPEDMPWKERDHAWFVAFAPVDNPRIAVVVLNEHGGHGSSGAAPTAMKLIQKFFELEASDAALREGSHESSAPALKHDGPAIPAEQEIKARG